MQTETKEYEIGLEKTRKEFTSKLNLLTLKHNIIDEEYYEELEDILITADIGVNTVMDFIERLRKRVKQENIKTFAETVLQDINPRNSWRAGRALRRHISVVMAERALRECIILAGGEING